MTWEELKELDGENVWVKSVDAGPITGVLKVTETDEQITFEHPGFSDGKITVLQSSMWFRITTYQISLVL